VLILIDSRASLNFVSNNLVHKLGLEIDPTKPYYVSWGLVIEIYLRMLQETNGTDGGHM